MSIFLDAAVVVILTLTCVFGYTRGFIKYVIFMAGTLVAVVVSLFVSAQAAAPVYDNYVSPYVVSAVTSAVNNIDVQQVIMNKLSDAGLGDYLSYDDVSDAVSKGGELSENIGSALTEKGADSDTVTKAKEAIGNLCSDYLPDEIKSRLATDKYSELFDLSDIENSKLKDCASDVLSGEIDSAVNQLEQSYVRPVAVTVIRYLIFALCYVAVEIIIRLILILSGVFTKLPPLSAANKLGGLALGAVKGCLYISLIAFALCAVVNATQNSLPVFNSRFIDSTLLFKYFFDFFYK
jgi:hypothetical protein